MTMETIDEKASTVLGCQVATGDDDGHDDKQNTNDSSRNCEDCTYEDEEDAQTVKAGTAAQKQFEIKEGENTASPTSCLARWLWLIMILVALAILAVVYAIVATCAGRHIDQENNVRNVSGPQ